ncbi:PAS domain S-box protein [Nocardioides sp. W3-2-3]|nr:PAS domain S-box protein [Nocardioides convexus]
MRSRLSASGLFDVVGEGADGGEAMILAHQHEPDLMLLDTSMPVLDGLEALPLVLAVSPRTKVVVFTGFEGRGLATRAREPGGGGLHREVGADREVCRSLLWQHVDRPEADVRRPRSLGLHVADGLDESAARDQAALDEHRERYQEAFEQAAIGMATMTLNGSIVRANPELAEMVGRVPDDLVGLDYGVLTRQHGDHLDEALARITEGDEDLVTFEHPLVSDGGASTLRVTLAPIRDSRGQPLYVFAQVQDITAEIALRRSEEMFRLLVTAVTDYAIYLLDTDGRVASLEPRCAEHQGLRRGRDRGSALPGLLPRGGAPRGAPRAQPRVRPGEGDLRRGGLAGAPRREPVLGQRPHHGRLRRRRSPPRVRQDHPRPDPAARARGAPQGRHRAAGAPAGDHRPRACARPRPWSRVPSRSCATAGTPSPTTPATRLLEAMASSAHRLQRLVSDLSAASDVHADALALEPERVSLRTTLLAAADRSRAVHPHERIAVEVSDETEIFADPARLGQALDNLLENALRHGRAPVLVTGEPTADGVRIRVSDDGHGVDERLLDESVPPLRPCRSHRRDGPGPPPGAGDRPQPRGRGALPRTDRRAPDDLRDGAAQQAAGAEHVSRPWPP